LDKKSKMTNTAKLDDYGNPYEAYEEYKKTKSEVDVTYDFKQLQSFLYGNKEINPDEIVRNLQDSFKQYTSYFSKIFQNNELIEKIELVVNTLTEEFKGALSIASKQIKPIEDMRNLLVNKHIGELKGKDGIVIDKIWALIKDKIPNISKDQFFGRKPLSPIDNSDWCPIPNSIIGCYSVLNFLGYDGDRKLSNIKTISGSNSDVSHLCHGSFCSFFLSEVSEDSRLITKAKAIFQYLGVKTWVLKLNIDKGKGEN